MLNWIRRRLFERSREIFVYWDGARRRRIDPLAAFRAMRTHARFDPDTHLALADRGDLNAIEITLEATREIFDVKELNDGEGLTINETLNLAGSFVGYLHTLKKNGSPPPISPEPTERESLEAKYATTNAPSDSGSMPSASSSAELGLS